MKNLIVWIIGANACGKTTLARRIHQVLSTSTVVTPTYLERELPGGKKYAITLLSDNSANLGILSVEGACSGTDSLNTKEKIQAAFHLACKQRRVVVVEGIMATGTWIDFLATGSTRLLLIHLKLNEEENLKRLEVRRAEKRMIKSGGLKIDEEIVISEKTRQNIATKRKTFKNLFIRLSPDCDMSLEIDTTGKNEEDVWNILKPVFIKFMMKYA